MTLNESLQFGCVPLVYDTCASFHEIINDGENGYLVTDKNEEEFYHRARRTHIGRRNIARGDRTARALPHPAGRRPARGDMHRRRRLADAAGRHLRPGRTASTSAARHRRCARSASTTTATAP